MVAKKREGLKTLSKVDVPLTKLAMTVNTLDAKQLVKRGIYDTQEAFRFLPGVNGRVAYGAFNRLSIRGFDNQPVMVDGIRDERSAEGNSYPLSDLSDVESIEVLKGPASVLQGHTAVGGILNITRRQPSERRLFESKISVASWNRKQASIILGGKLFDGLNNISGVNFSDGNGWRNTGNRRFKAFTAFGGEYDQHSYELRFGFNRDFYGTEIGLPPIYYKNVYNTDGSVYLKPGEMQLGIKRSNRYNSESDFFYHQNFNTSFKYSYTFNNGLKLTEYVDFAHDLRDYLGTEELQYVSSKEPVFSHYIETPKGKEYIDLDHVYYAFPLRFAHVNNTIQNHLTLNGSFTTGEVKHNFATGYSFSNMHHSYYAGYSEGDITGPGTEGIVDVKDPHTMGYISARLSKGKPAITMTNAIFAQDVVELLDNLTLMGALRYDWFHYESGPYAPTINYERKYRHPARDQYSISNNHALTYRLGLVYNPFKDVTLYTSLANFYTPLRKFYSNKIIYIDNNGNRFEPGQKEPFKPETGYQIELGARVNINKYLSAQISGFYIKQKDMVKNLGSRMEQDKETGKEIKKSLLAQIGEIESKGFEVEANSNPINGLLLSAGYSFTDAKLLNVARNQFLEKDLQGGEVKDVPKNKFYSLGSYTIPKGALAGLGFRYSYSITGKILRYYGEDIYFKAYDVLDLGASYTFKNKITLGVDVYNVFDKKYFNANLYDQLVPGAPTNVRLSLSYKL